MNRLVLLVGNALRGILYARSIYLWLLAALLVTVQILPLLLVQNPTVPSGIRLNAEQQERIANAIRNRRPNTMASGFNNWSVLCIIFGILVGANALATEVNKKTIITVLARPVERWEFLLSKWLAIQVFSAGSLLVGLGLFEVAGRYFEVTFSSAVWMALLHAYIATMVYSAAAIALSTLLSPALAGGLSALAALVPGLTAFLLSDANRLRHAIGVVLDYLVPPGYSNLYAVAVQANAVLDYSAQSKTLLTNLLYCAIFLFLGGLVFKKREVRLG